VAKKVDKAAKVTEKERKEVEAEVAKDKLAELEDDESFIQQQEQAASANPGNHCRIVVTTSKP
jgi:hypothetical protein